MFKPLDLQTMLPRSLQLQKIQLVQNVRPISEQQEATREMQARVKKREETVPKSNETAAQSRIRNNADEQPKQREYRLRRFYKPKVGQNEIEENDEISESERGQHIDFKI